MLEGIHLLKFFDNFGLVVFTFIIIDSIIDLTNKKTRTWRAWVRLVIGILGLLTDLSLIIYTDISVTGVRWRSG